MRRLLALIEWYRSGFRSGLIKWLDELKAAIEKSNRGGLTVEEVQEIERWNRGEFTLEEMQQIEKCNRGGTP